MAAISDVTTAGINPNTGCFISDSTGQTAGQSIKTVGTARNVQHLVLKRFEVTAVGSGETVTIPGAVAVAVQGTTPNVDIFMARVSNVATGTITFTSGGGSLTGFLWVLMRSKV